MAANSGAPGEMVVNIRRASASRLIVVFPSGIAWVPNRTVARIQGDLKVASGGQHAEPIVEHAPKNGSTLIITTTLPGAATVIEDAIKAPEHYPNADVRIYQEA